MDHVLVRGKAGAEVEFGNTVLLGENRQGFIWDYQIGQEQAPAGMHLLVESLERVLEGLRRGVTAVGADRGFACKLNTGGLKEAEIYNGVCPRHPHELQRTVPQSKRQPFHDQHHVPGLGPEVTGLGW